MRACSSAIEWVRVVADRLGPLRSEVVFLGGATIDLLLTDRAAPRMDSPESMLRLTPEHLVSMLIK